MCQATTTSKRRFRRRHRAPRPSSCYLTLNRNLSMARQPRSSTTYSVISKSCLRRSRSWSLVTSRTSLSPRTLCRWSERSLPRSSRSGKCARPHKPSRPTRAIVPTSTMMTTCKVTLRCRVAIWSHSKDASASTRCPIKSTSAVYQSKTIRLMTSLDLLLSTPEIQKS